MEKSLSDVSCRAAFGVHFHNIFVHALRPQMSAVRTFLEIGSAENVVK